MKLAKEINDKHSVTRARRMLDNIAYKTKIRDKFAIYSFAEEMLPCVCIVSVDRTGL